MEMAACLRQPFLFVAFVNYIWGNISTIAAILFCADIELNKC